MAKARRQKVESTASLRRAAESAMNQARIAIEENRKSVAFVMRIRTVLRFWARFAAALADRAAKCGELSETRGLSLRVGRVAVSVVRPPVPFDFVVDSLAAYRAYCEEVTGESGGKLIPPGQMAFEQLTAEFAKNVFLQRGKRTVFVVPGRQ